VLRNLRLNTADSEDLLSIGGLPASPLCDLFGEAVLLFTQEPLSLGAFASWRLLQAHRQDAKARRRRKRKKGRELLIDDFGGDDCDQGLVALEAGFADNYHLTGTDIDIGGDVAALSP